MGLDLTLGGLILFLGIRLAQRIHSSGGCLAVSSAASTLPTGADVVLPRVLNQLPNIHPILSVPSSGGRRRLPRTSFSSGWSRWHSRWPSEGLGRAEPNRNDISSAASSSAPPRGSALRGSCWRRSRSTPWIGSRRPPWAESQVKTSRTLQWNERLSACSQGLGHDARPALCPPHSAWASRTCPKPTERRRAASPLPLGTKPQARFRRTDSVRREGH